VPNLPVRPVLTLDVARALADAAEAHIRLRGFAMFVAIVDTGATPLFVARYNDAQAASYEIAVAKAQAAVRFRRPTLAFQERILRDGRTNLLSMPGIVAVEGGVPIVVDGVLVGGIGVSGGTGEQDGEVAAAALKALG
jgi:glc operon protein GlcG